MSAILPTALSTVAVPEHSGAGTEATPTSTEAALVQPAETVSRLFNLAGNPASNAQSSSSMSSPSFSASLSTISDLSSTTKIRNVAATLLSSSAANQVLSSVASPTASAITGTIQVASYSTTPVPTYSSDAASQASTPVVVPVPISSGLVQVLAASSDTFAPVTLNPNSPAPTGTAKYPTAENGNTAMAAGFNSIYKTLNVDSPCNPGDPNEAYACVDGEIAECQSDETYVIKSCFPGQSCYALPKASGLTGIVVQCAVPSVAYSVLAGLSSSTAVPVAITSQPAQILQVEEGLSQATQSASTQNPAEPVTSSPSVQATFESQTVAPTTTVIAVTATSSHDQGSNRIDRAAVSTSTSSTAVQEAFQSQSQAFDSPVPAVTATARQISDLSPLTSSTTTDTPPSVSSTAPAVLNSPLTSDTSPSVSFTTPAVETIPNALFAVVTAPESEPASTSEDSKQSSVTTSQTSQTHPAVSTPIIQYSPMSPPADPDNLQATEASATNTSTSSTDGATITSAPTGLPVNEKVAVGNGQATVTVTVTVTTTERPAPVTVIAS